MAETKPDISIIIVNYRVKDYISLLLDSISKAKNNLDIEIFIVDNNSKDDSIEYLSSLYKDLNFIENDENKGFGKANNQAIEKASGAYTLLINPDTIVEEESFLRLKGYMDQNRNCAVAGFKMLNPDGSFAKESKRSLPDLKSGIFRVLALDTVFPNSKFFGARYLRWIPETEIAEVPVISGAGMFWRTEVLKDLNGFDESFFMYGEDDDLCFRVQETEFNIKYFPEAKLIHFKGESERPTSMKNLKKINQGLIQFFKKHYSEKYSAFSLWLISFAFYLRVLLIFFKTLLFGFKNSIQKKVTSVILIGEYDIEILSKQLNKEKKSIKTIASEMEIDEIIQEVHTLTSHQKDKSMVVFDVSSISYSKVFNLVEQLKNNKLNFNFLLNQAKKVIGKSSVINL